MIGGKVGSRQGHYFVVLHLYPDRSVGHKSIATQTISEGDPVAGEIPDATAEKADSLMPLLYAEVLSHKADASAGVQRLLARARDDHGHLPNHVVFRCHSDRGQEFLNRSLEKYCEEHAMECRLLRCYHAHGEHCRNCWHCDPGSVLVGCVLCVGYPLCWISWVFSQDRLGHTLTSNWCRMAGRSFRACQCALPCNGGMSFRIPPVEECCLVRVGHHWSGCSLHTSSFDGPPPSTLPGLISSLTRLIRNLENWVIASRQTMCLAGSPRSVFCLLSCYFPVRSFTWTRCMECWSSIFDQLVWTCPCSVGCRDEV